MQTPAPAPATNLPSPVRDPRLRGRTNSMHAADGLDAAKARPWDRRGEDAPSTSIPQSTTGRLDNTSKMPSEPSEFETTFSSHITNAIKAEYWTRKRDFLRNQAKDAQQEYEREQKRSIQFPVIIDQLLQKKTQVDAEYYTAKREENLSIATAETSAGRFIRLLLDAVNAKNDQIRTLSDQVGNLRQDLKDLRTQQAEASALSRPQSDELDRRLRRLEGLHDQQMFTNGQLKTLDDQFNDFKRKVEEDRASHTEACKHSHRQVEDLLSERRASDKDVKTTIDVLKTENDALRKSLKGLEQKSREEVQQVQEGLRAAQQATEQIERVRRSIHLKVENMHGELKTDYRALRSELSSLPSQVSTLKESIDATNASIAGDRLQITAVQNEITSLKEENKDQSGQVTSLLEDLSKELSTFREAVEASKVSAAEDRLKITTVQDEITSLKQENKDQSEQVTSSLKDVSKELNTVQTRLSEVETVQNQFDAGGLSEKLKSLQTQADGFIADGKHAMAQVLAEELEAVRAQLDDRMSKSDQSQAKLREDLSLIQQQVTEFEATQRSDRTLASGLNSLQLQFAQHTAKYASSMEKFNNSLISIQTEFADLVASRDRADVEKIVKELKSLRLQLAEQANKLQDSKQTFNDEIQQHKQQLAKYAKTFQESEKQRDDLLVGELAQIQHEQELLKSEIKALREEEAPPDEDQQVKAPPKPIPSAGNVHLEIELLQRDYQKLMHMFLGLNHRCDTFATDSFSRAMLGRLHKAVPQIQSRLEDVDVDVNDLRNRLESLHAKVENIATDQGKTGGTVAELQSKYGTFEQQFPEARDRLVKDTEELTTSIGRVDSDRSTHRELGDKNVETSQAKPDAIGHELNGFKHAHQLPSLNDRRGAISLEADAPSIVVNGGSQVIPDEADDGTIMVEGAESAQKNSSPTAHRVLDDDDEALGQAKPELAKTPRRQIRQRRSGYDTPTLKRSRPKRHVESSGRTTDSDDDVRPPRRKTRR